MTETLEVLRGDRFEFWARARQPSGNEIAPFLLRSGSKILYRLNQLPPYFEHFAYTSHEAGEVELEWESEALEVSLFYRYNPASVASEGVTFFTFTDTGLEAWPQGRWPSWYGSETARPALRFSPFQGWMNDPNGLCRVGDRYHMFYQLHPNGTDWGPMHWGHAVSTDLYRWIHYPVFVHPEQNLAALAATGGAFSGNAFFDRDGSLSFYYTERLPAYDLFKDYHEVQKRMVPSADLIEPVANRLVLAEGPVGTAHDIRDPKVWFDAEAGLYRMVLGAAVDGDPATLLHSSHDGMDWSFTSVLYRAPARFREGGARCAECPDFFTVNGHWVLVVGFVGYTEAETGRHNLLYATVGSFADGVFTPYSDELQELDFGTDYYAMQSFPDGDRQLAFAWLFNWEFRKPAGSVYSGEMSLPRVIGVDADRRLTMRPEPGYQALRKSELRCDGGQIALENPTDAIELVLTGDLVGLTLTGRSTGGARFELAERDGRLLVRMPEDNGKITYRSAPLALRQLTVFFDRGVLEIFANDGAVCGTRRSYGIADLAELHVTPDPHGKATCEAWSYRSAWGD